MAIVRLSEQEVTTGFVAFDDKTQEVFYVDDLFKRGTFPDTAGFEDTTVVLGDKIRGVAAVHSRHMRDRDTPLPLIFCPSTQEPPKDAIVWKEISTHDYGFSVKRNVGRSGRKRGTPVALLRRVIDTGTKPVKAPVQLRVSDIVDQHGKPVFGARLELKGKDKHTADWHFRATRRGKTVDFFVPDHSVRTKLLFACQRAMARIGKMPPCRGDAEKWSSLVFAALREVGPSDYLKSKKAEWNPSEGGFVVRDGVFRVGEGWVESVGLLTQAIGAKLSITPNPDMTKETIKRSQRNAWTAAGVVLSDLFSRQAQDFAVVGTGVYDSLLEIQGDLQTRPTRQLNKIKCSDELEALAHCVAGLKHVVYGEGAGACEYSISACHLALSAATKAGGVEHDTRGPKRMLRSILPAFGRGTKTVETAAANCLDCDSNEGVGEAFVRLVKLVTKRGLVKTSLQAKGRGKPGTFWATRRPEGLFVPWGVLEDALKEKNLPAFDRARVQEALEARNLVTSTEPRDGTLGVTLSKQALS